MVRIRLRRIGLKGQPSYRIVAADKESPRDGRFLEILGFYNPRTEPVEQIFKSAGTLERWERFKQGEDINTLMTEAAEAEASRNTTAKTRRD